MITLQVNYATIQRILDSARSLQEAGEDKESLRVLKMLADKIQEAVKNASTG